MALTTKTNGSTSANIITASWFNDFTNLLTGGMQDQQVSIKNNVELQAIGAAPSAGPTLATATGTTLGIGAYIYAFSYVSSDGETVVGPTASITTTSGNTNVSLSAISVGPTGTISRRIYRTKVGATQLFLLTTIANNTATTYTDSTADASLSTTTNPSHSTFGGSLLVKDSTGTTKGTWCNDGTLNLVSGSIRRMAILGGFATQTLTHNWGEIPDIIIVSYAGGFGGPPTHPIYWYSATSTTVNVVADSGYSWLALLIKA